MIVSLYAALLGLVFVFFSIRIVLLRYKYKAPFGDAGQDHLQRVIRVHGNFIEYVPMALLLLFLAEVQGLPVWATHALGASLVVGRLWHAFAIGGPAESISARFAFRAAGMVLTFAVISVLSAYLLTKAAALL